MTRETFARWVFRIAGIYGLLVLTPMLALEERIGREQPPAITHTEYFYGFLGVALAWQAAFLIISCDPARYRPLMPACILEKAGFAITTIALFVQGRLAAPVLAGGMIDLVLGALFLTAYLRLRPERG
jgi:hypothetical protein